MTAKTESVHFMNETTFLDRIFQSLVGRIFLACLQTALGSALLLLVFIFRQSVDLTTLIYAVVVGVGLLAGFSARRFLAGHTRPLKLLTAILAAALSLAVLYTLSGGFLGVNLFFQSHATPDWIGLIQLLVAAAAAWLVQQAFSKTPIKEETPASAPTIQPAAPASRPTIKNWTAKLSLTKLKTSPVNSASKVKSKKAEPALAIQKKTKKTTNIQKLAVTPTKVVSVPKPAKKAKKAKKPAQTAQKRAKKVTKEIKFIGAEEHVCPYCLDPVEAHDARGVKICPICKTHHHADCWGITGACQIPHTQG